MNAESPTPGRSLPSKQELLDFQSTWLKRAGAGALGGALIVAAAIALQRVGLHPPDSDSDADQLVFAHAHHSRLIWTSFLQGLGFALFAVPLAFLYRSAAGRAARVRNAFIGVVVLGPLAFGIGVAISSIGTSQAADKFLDQEPAKVQQARQQAEQAQSAPTAKPTTAQSTTATGSTTSGTTTTATGATTTAVAKPKTPDQAASDAREDLADHLNRHTTILIIGGLISTIGVLGLVFGMIYTNLWSMRVGLVRRFWGALGMAIGLFLVIPLFPPIPGLVFWFAVTGLMFLGFWPRPLPPAWGAGEAIPWARPGDSIGPPPVEPGPPGTVEGSGREVPEQPLADEEPGNGEPPEPPYGETQGQRRKKRKRRG